MSNVYATEPATSGRVIFDTTHGPIEIQLWCTECPETTRIFLQLCLDGYFDNMVFHRIMPDFLIQTGTIRQPPVEGKAPISMEEYRSKIRADEALERRQYEVHSRLKFNHRGQVAMALTVSGDEGNLEELQPQFFITLQDTPFLDGKHVLFGTVAGPTVFNAIRIGGTEVDEETNQPAGDIDHAPRVKSVKIVENPLHSNLTPKPNVPWKVLAQAQDEKAKKKKKRKGKRDINVLSFGDEMDQGEELGGMKSSHDLLESRRLSKKVDATVRGAVETASIEKTEKKQASSKRRKLEAAASADAESDKGQLQQNDEEPRNGEQPRENLETKQEVSASSPPSQKNLGEEEAAAAHTILSNTKQEKKRKPALSLVEARRSKYIKEKKSKQKREDDTMEKLFAFRSKVRGRTSEGASGNAEKKDRSLASRMAERAEKANRDKCGDESAPTYHGQILESDGEEEGGSDWLQTKFKCRRHMDHQTQGVGQELGGDGRNMNDYEVVDEKEGGQASGSHQPRQHPHGHHRGQTHGHHRADHNGERKNRHRR